MTNVKLSKEELSLVTDAEIILTKNRIIQRVYALFGELSEVYVLRKGLFSQEAAAIAPKISRGENYRDLPWVMLDYPRRFSQADVFAARSFFWWGNFFSFTIQLKGVYLDQYRSKLDSLRKKGWWICGDASGEWQHSFEHYARFEEQSLESLPFVKLTKKIPLQEWDKAFDFFSGAFGEMTDHLSAEAMK